MTEQILARATYWEGFPPWGKQSRDGQFVITPSNLIFRADNGEVPQMPLVKADLRLSIRFVTLSKKGVEGTLARWTSLALDVAEGMCILFSDEVGDTQSVYFRCSQRTTDRLEEIVEKAIFHRRRTGTMVNAEGQGNSDKATLIRKLAELRDAGILTEEEFQEKIQVILRGMK